MSTESLFELLDPPSGGAERFERRLAEAAASTGADPRRRIVALAGVACAAAAVAVAVVLLRGEHIAEPPPSVANSAIYDSPAFDRLLGRPIRASELSVRLDERTAAVTEIATQNDKIRIYRID